MRKYYYLYRGGIFFEEERERKGKGAGRGANLIGKKEERALFEVCVFSI